MSVENLEERTVEVLALPPGVDEELLSLYFENKRRSGGGPLVSLEKKGDGVVLVFEEAEGKWQHRVYCLGYLRSMCIQNIFVFHVVHPNYLKE